MMLVPNDSGAKAADTQEKSLIGAVTSAPRMVGALDYIVYEAGMQHTNGNLLYPDRIKFPITDRRDHNVWRSILGNQLREVGRRQRAIIKRHQPFNRWWVNPRHGAAYHPLSMLRDLSDMDKHRLLTAVVVPLGYGGVWTGGNMAGAIIGSAEKQGRRGGYFDYAPAEQGAELARAKLDAAAPKEHVKMACSVARMEVLFGDEFRRPVLPVIGALGATVVKILRELEPTLKRGASRL